MSDHVDGPRSVGDPAADLTDLFAFTNPENPQRTVLGACVFPSAGEDALFSNVIDYSITDQSHLEIEKTTINGRPYHTGGTRTVDANSIDMLLSWLVNRGREFLQSGATGATKPGTKVFPYFAAPNTELQTVVQSIELAAAPDDVWSLIGDFGGSWHPLTARVTLTGSGIGQLRTLETLDGQTIVE